MLLFQRMMSSSTEAILNAMEKRAARISEEKGEVSKENILYKCGWSPFEGETFNHKVTHTVVNGRVVFENGLFDETVKGMALQFNR